MQTKLDGLTREVFDLQETINWKDKKMAVGRPSRALGSVRGGGRSCCSADSRLCMTETVDE